MTIPFFQVDAFTSRAFSGNPAGVCLLDAWLPDALLQAIAEEQNLPETAFLVDGPDATEIRWFSPRVEIDLCGHATLACGHVMLRHLDPAAERVEFHSRSGILAVERRHDVLHLDFPARKPVPCAAPDDIGMALGSEPSAVLRSRDLVAVFEDEETVRGLAPDFDAVARLDAFGLIATAPGRDCDFVSRFFAPRAGIPEDPVTGSTHCTLIPYWSQRLGRRTLHAFQLSRRGGELFCEDRDERVSIGGHCTTFLTGSIQL